MNNNVNSCKIIDLNLSKSSQIIHIQNKIDIPFQIKRLYYLYDLSVDSVRGEHAHKRLYQLIICLNKQLKIKLDDGKNKKTVILNKISQGLLVVPGIWRCLSDFSKDSVCLVLASELYSEDDYIRDYKQFLKYKNDTS